MTPEAALSKSVTQWLALQESLGRLRWWRNNSGAIKPEGRFVAYGLRYRGKDGKYHAGGPDYLVALPGGRAMGVELKAPKGRLSTSQKAWAAYADGFLRVYVCRSLDDVRRAVEDQRCLGMAKEK